MRKTELEYKVLEIIDRVKNNKKVEDSTVELKAEWLDDHRKTARHIAAHANAARGESITWIIGLDEKRGVVGVDDREFANWWPQVNCNFETVFPDLVINFPLPYDGKTLYVLHFETDRAPYVVRTGEGVVTLEVPWREGNRVRSATRSDLLRILVPLSRLPSVEIINAVVERHINRHPENMRWLLKATIYVEPQGPVPIYIPLHRSSASLSFIPPEAKPLEVRFMVGTNSTTIAYENGQVCLRGPEQFRIEAEATFSKPSSPPEPPEFDATIHLGIAPLDGVVPIHIPFKMEGNKSGVGIWKMKS